MLSRKSIEMAVSLAIKLRNEKKQLVVREGTLVHLMVDRDVKGITADDIDPSGDNDALVKAIYDSFTDTQMDNEGKAISGSHSTIIENFSKSLAEKAFSNLTSIRQDVIPLIQRFSDDIKEKYQAVRKDYSLSTVATLKPIQYVEVSEDLTKHKESEITEDMKRIFNIIHSNFKPEGDVISEGAIIDISDCVNDTNKVTIERLPSLVSTFNEVHKLLLDPYFKSGGSSKDNTEWAQVSLHYLAHYIYSFNDKIMNDVKLGNLISFTSVKAFDSLVITDNASNPKTIYYNPSVATLLGSSLEPVLAGFIMSGESISKLNKAHLTNELIHHYKTVWEESLNTIFNEKNTLNKETLIKIYSNLVMDEDKLQNIGNKEFNTRDPYALAEDVEYIVRDLITTDLDETADNLATEFVCGTLLSKTDSKAIVSMLNSELEDDTVGYNEAAMKTMSSLLMRFLLEQVHIYKE